MLKNNSKYIVFLLVLTFIGCAKRGSITGGLKDSLAPVLKMSYPKNFSTNFKANEIKLSFDEFIKLKDLSKQLIVSPPLKNEPLILPTSVSKYITIKINDTLQENTTYSFNFGQSIADNNEGNVLNQFKYVFSTGAYIDSLKVSGVVRDAYDKDVESFVSIMLYEVNDAFYDSIVYKKNPTYITNTLDSSKTFKLDNLKAGKYFLVAMKDYNKDNKFNPNKDKIGFKKEYITLPQDSIQDLKIFKENAAVKVNKPYQASSNRLVVPYEGRVKSYDISLKKGDSLISAIVTKFPKKDSLQIWYQSVKTDSLAFTFSQDKYSKRFSIPIRKQKRDSLSFSTPQNGQINLKDAFIIKSETPLVRFDHSKIKLFAKDTVKVDYTTHYDEFNQEFNINFEKEFAEKYTIKLLPGALTDYFEKSNDTLNYVFNTKRIDELGNLNVTLQNVKRFPVIVELTNDKGELLVSQYSEKSTQIAFKWVEPAQFFLRLIYDDNKNKEWDTGNYSERLQPEEIIYFSKVIDVRANWDIEQVFDVSLPYVPTPIKKQPKDKPNGMQF